MNEHLKKVALASLITLFASSSYAQGVLNISSTGPGGDKALTIIDVGGGSYEGTYTTASGTVAVSATISLSSIFVRVGPQVSFLTVTRNVGSTVYAGDFLLGPGTVTATFKKNKILFDGTVGVFDDFTGKRDGDGDKLVLAWGSSKFKVETRGTGMCYGGERTKGVGVNAVSCDSSGSLFEAIFNNPDGIVTWIVNIFVDAE